MIKYNTKSSGGNPLWSPPDKISKGQTWIRGRGTLKIPKTLSEIQNPGIGGQWSLKERMSFADRIKKEKEQESYLTGLAEEEEKEEALKRQKINPEEGNLQWNKETKTWSRLPPPRPTPEMPSWQKEQFRGIYGPQSIGNQATPRLKDSFDKMMGIGKVGELGEVMGGLEKASMRLGEAASQRRIAEMEKEQQVKTAGIGQTARASEKADLESRLRQLQSNRPDMLYSEEGDAWQNEIKKLQNQLSLLG